MENCTFSPLGNPTVKLAYWDENAYVAELMVNAEDDFTQQPATEAGSSERSPGAALADKEGNMKPVKDSEIKSKKRKVEAGAASSNKKVISSVRAVGPRLHSRRLSRVI